MSSNVGYTQGPWTYFVGNANGRGLIRIESCLDASVAGVHIASMPRNKQSEANARLIAASPELLEALKGLVSLAKDCVADAEDWHDYQHAVAVIAKVEGK